MFALRNQHPNHALPKVITSSSAILLRQQRSGIHKNIRRFHYMSIPRSCPLDRYRQSQSSRQHLLITSPLLSSSSLLSPISFCNSNSIYSNRSFSSSSINSNPSSYVPKEKPFDKVLVANRGEIACRVLRTCRDLGIQTVAIYSPADGRDSLHARMADECYMIGSGGSSSAAESYLLGEEVIDIALCSGAQAIHPGYGFLSENANFAELIQQRSSSTPSGLTFVGPSPSAILSMGDKSHSKDIMEKANVCTTPGYHGSNQDPEYLLHEAVHNVGFPLLIKATMGGGGKGMRLVHSENEFLSALESCQREALNSFGDSTVLLEKYLVDPRHVEVQIVADSHGNCLYLHERDCSLQRRHQKILEEAPASYLSLSTRQQMGEMAVKAAKAVKYVNAGTVEFLFESSSDEFYFCEMNTRLQVEHPITELITGIDLVEWQLRIAAGESLPIEKQEDVPCIGHAMEARIYAENTKKGFMPAVGKVWHHSPPVQPNVGSVPVSYTHESKKGEEECVARVDTGLQTNDVLTVHYDPMISKLIVHAPTRLGAIETLQKSLNRYHLAGIPNNIPFLQDCLNHETFRKEGGVDTGFLEREEAYFLRKDGRGGGMEEEWNVDMIQQSPLSVAVGVFGVLMKLDSRVGLAQNSGPWSNLSGSWRMGGNEGRFQRRLVPMFSGTEESPSSAIVTIECASNRDGSYEIAILSSPSPSHYNNDKEINADEDIDMANLEQKSVFTINGTLDHDGTMKVLIDGNKRMSFVVMTNEEEDKSTFDISLWSSSETSGVDTYSAWNMSFHHPLPAFASSSRDNESSMLEGCTSTGRKRSVKSPMPGKIIRLNVAEGKEVKEGDILLVMEAMKMEHVVRSPLDGVVRILKLDVGDIVEDGCILAVVEDDVNDGSDDEEKDQAVEA